MPLEEGERHVSAVPREALPYQGQRAGLVTRSGAAVVDGLVIVAAILAGSLAVSGVVFLLDPRDFSLPDPSLLGGTTLLLIVAVGYLTLGWSLSGRTYGCHVIGLRVVTPSGRHPRATVALARAALCVFFPIGLAWCAVSKNQRSVQDVLLRTIVIYDWTSVESAPPQA